MNVITCRSCNHVNPLGSKFCNHCGTALPPQTTQICANCGTTNPQNRLYCDSCGSRLGALGRLPREEKPTSETPPAQPTRHGFVLPSRRPGDTGELDPDDLPEWLKTGERPGAEPSPERQSHITDWLQKLTELKEEEDPNRLTVDYGFLERPKWPGRERRTEVEETQTPRDELPEDLFEEVVNEEESATSSLPGRSKDKPQLDMPPTPPSFTAHKGEGEPATKSMPTDEFEDWQTDFAPEEADLTTGRGVADWLTTWADDESNQGSAPNVADWLTDSPTLAESASQPELSDWDTDWDTPEATSSAITPREDWLTDLAPGTESEDEAEIDWSALPNDWLTTLEETEAESAQSRLTATPMWPESSLRDEPWLDDEPALAEFTQRQEQSSPSAFEKASITDWLAELTVNTPAAAEEKSSSPGWLDDFPDDFGEQEAEASALSVSPQPDIPTAEADSLTDWLADLHGDEEASAAIVNWLSDEDEPSPEIFSAGETDVTDEITGGEEIDLSSWLHELEADTDEDDAAAVAATSLAENDLPDWFTEFETPITESRLTPDVQQPAFPDNLLEPDTALADTTDSDVPEWLSQLRSADTTFFVAPEEVEAAPPPVEEKVSEPILPDWFMALEQETESTDFEPTVPESAWPISPKEAPPPVEKRMTAEPTYRANLEGIPQELARAELPDWLQQSLNEGNVVSTSRPSLELPDLPLPQSDLPEWLSPQGDEDFDTALEAALSVQGSELVGSPLSSEWADILGDMAPGEALLSLERAEIPEWIQELRPRDTADEAPEAELEPEEPAGPLAGLRGVIPIEPVVAQPKMNIAATHYTTTKEHKEQAAMLYQLIHAEPEILTQVGQKRASMSVLIRVGMAILLLLAVVAGLFLPNMPLVLPSPVTGVEAAQSAIAAAAGSTVLVAFEYTPGLAGELDPQAQLILGQLAASGKQIVVVSQYAAGLGQANSLGLDVAATQFIPGETIGLRALAACLNGSSDCFTLFGSGGPLLLAPGEVGLIVVLTGERDSLLGWMEQVAPQTENIPLVVGTTQGLAPLAQPYLGSQQIDGLIAGLPGAAAYEMALTGETGVVGKQLQAQALAQLLIVILLLVGAVYYALTGLSRK
ncbi:MAG: zinc ribbon domain-containing protein [Candidatus Promineifilaceae bacterium]